MREGTRRHALENRTGARRHVAGILDVNHALFKVAQWSIIICHQRGVFRNRFLVQSCHVMGTKKESE